MERSELPRVLSHYYLSLLTGRLLGYNSSIPTAKKRTVYVNGSDIDALAGYLLLDINEGEVVKKALVR